MKARLILGWAILLMSTVAFSQHTKNVLIYDLTSTNCGDCSCMDSIFKHTVLPAYSNTVIVAFHSKDSEFLEYQGSCIRNHFRESPGIGPSCFPDGLGYDVAYLDILDTLDRIYQDQPETPIAIEVLNKEFDAESRWVDIDIAIRNDGQHLPQAYRYNVMLVEDNIIAWHRIKDSCGTQNHEIVPFDTLWVNNGVTRIVEYCCKGLPVVKEGWPAQHEIQFTTKFHIDDSWVADNCHIVVSVYKYNDDLDSLYRSPVQQVIKKSILEPSSTAETEAAIKTMKVYPNPAKGFANLHFSLSSGAKCSLNMYDMNGNNVKTVLNNYVKAGSYNLEINTQGLPKGSYILVLETNGGKESEKLVIM